jgi:predicted RNase H-like nuclease (RuvC/YqgF family)
VTILSSEVSAYLAEARDGEDVSAFVARHPYPRERTWSDAERELAEARAEIERQKADRQRQERVMDEMEAEIERLNNLLRLALDEKADVIKEIEQLRKKAGQRGARMQIMREWIAMRAGIRVWASFCLEHPEAANWFDADGVPK